MMGRETEEAPGAVGQPLFATTHWSVVLAAGHGPSAAAQSALEQLCRIYWYPLYAHVRRRGYSPEDAQDLTQEFFARLLAKHWLSMADARRGRFRTFLLAALDHFLAHEWERARCEKRGGGKAIFSLDVEGAEARYHLEPMDRADAGWLYERRWALTLLDRVLGRLREEYSAAGKADLYERLRRFPLTEKSDRSFQQAASELGMTVSALKSVVHRLRARYRQLVRDEGTHARDTPPVPQGRLNRLSKAALTRDTSTHRSSLRDECSPTLPGPRR